MRNPLPVWATESLSLSSPMWLRPLCSGVECAPCLQTQSMCVRERERETDRDKERLIPFHNIDPLAAKAKGMAHLSHTFADVEETSLPCRDRLRSSVTISGLHAFPIDQSIEACCESTSKTQRD